LQRTTKIRIPARMEIVQRAGHTLVIDGAHNAQKLTALGASLDTMFGDQQSAVLFNLVQSSRLRLRTSLKALTGFADHLIVTSFETQQDFLRQSMNPRKVLEACKELGFNSVEIVPQPSEAYKALLGRAEPIHVVTGSFYLLNHIRPLVFKHKL
jgi:dihydrofolate synthase/folylpolyglutamate synthase